MPMRFTLCSQISASKQIVRDSALTGGPTIRTCPGRGRRYLLNHTPEADDNKTVNPAIGNIFFVIHMLYKISYVHLYLVKAGQKVPLRNIT